MNYKKLAEYTVFVFSFSLGICITHQLNNTSKVINKPIELSIKADKPNEIKYIPCKHIIRVGGREFHCGRVIE